MNIMPVIGMQNNKNILFFGKKKKNNENKKPEIIRHQKRQEISGFYRYNSIVINKHQKTLKDNRKDQMMDDAYIAVMKKHGIKPLSIEEQNEVISEAVDFFSQLDIKQIFKSLEEEGKYSYNTQFIAICNKDTPNEFAAIGCRYNTDDWSTKTDYISKESLDKILELLKNKNN